MKAKTKTPWREGAPKPSYPELKGRVDADVAIIGGGITGLLSAYQLAKEGKSVVVLEAEELGEGATEYTTAFLTEIIDTNLSDLEGTYGKENAQRIVRSHREAITYIEGIVNDENIKCEFKRVSNYMYAGTHKEAKDLSDELEAGKKLDVDIARGTGQLGFTNYGYLEVKNQAKFHPLKFIYGVAQATLQHGGKIFQKSEAIAIHADNGTKVVRTRKGEVYAPKVVSATYSPFGEPAGLFLKKGMYVTYMHEIVVDKKIPEAIYEDMENPYHYFRVDIRNKKTHIIIGGEDHRRDVPIAPEKNFAALKTYIDEHFGESYTVVREWTGPILEPIDGLAFIGPYGESGIIYTFGFSGNGMTYAGIAARLIADYVEGRRSEYHELYAADRIPSPKQLLIKGRDYFEELAGGALKNATTHKRRK
ncbi:MAG TPA: FAD-binding oxidoreductase [Candidatus Paceibacterota bacterium]|nr:FAD-binding oxidoreductase [Candidatus Paceibacterota bacterium]